MKISATSRTGWWIAGLLEKQNSHPDRAPYWNNYILVRSHDWRTAFRRATEMGENAARGGVETFGGHQEFIGVSDLLPIYDEFEDGAELLWQELWPEAGAPDEAPLEVFSEANLESLYEDQDGHEVHPNDPLPPSSDSTSRS